MTQTSTLALRHVGLGLLFTILALGLTSFLAFGPFTSDAAGTVLIRGVIKPGGATDSVNVYITHVASAPDASAIQGIRTDVNVAKAKKFKWQVESGSLKKVRTTANPVPEKEVVIKGTLLDDNRITASWMVQNYREFHIEGTLQGRDLDTGSIDEGYVTVTVTKSVMRKVSPERKFKEATLKGTDLRIRINGSTSVNSIGSAGDWKSVQDQVAGTKGTQIGIHLDEVSESQQAVVVEGQMTDEDSWTASKYYQKNS